MWTDSGRRIRTRATCRPTPPNQPVLRWGQHPGEASAGTSQPSGSNRMGWHLHHRWDARYKSMLTAQHSGHNTIARSDQLGQPHLEIVVPLGLPEPRREDGPRVIAGSG